ncbi:type II secretion system protein, partial [bacterium]|nr:type II secretion system protein [bacterium]
MINTKKAFTLVELIVVITILAILGTIAFISLQGYSADARNSKRTSDLGNIQSAISLKQVEGVPLLSFVTNNAENDLVSPDIAGLLDAGTAYDAGTPSYTVLNVVEKDFKDPNDKAYRIGGTTYKGGAFQLAATMEVDGVDTAAVNGTYVARGSGTITPTSYDSGVVTIPDTSANFFKVNDTVTTASGTTTISKVSRDGVTITLASGTGAGDIQLAAAEETGLIGATIGTAGNPVVNLDTTDLDY